MKRINKPNNITEIAEKVIKSETDIELLSIHEFQNEEESHDDNLQKEIHKEYNTAFNDCLKDLEKEYGQSVVAKNEDDFDEVPLSGVCLAAKWKIDNGHLYLAVSHEDRETPILLIIGFIK